MMLSLAPMRTKIASAAVIENEAAGTSARTTRHDRGEAHLPNQRRLTPHVGPGQGAERASPPPPSLGHARTTRRERRRTVPESNSTATASSGRLRGDHRGGRTAPGKEHVRLAFAPDLRPRRAARRPPRPRGAETQLAAQSSQRARHQRAKAARASRSPARRRRLGTIVTDALSSGQSNFAEPLARTLPETSPPRRLGDHPRPIARDGVLDDAVLPLGPPLRVPTSHLQRLVRRAHPVVGGVHMTDRPRGGRGVRCPGASDWRQWETSRSSKRESADCSASSATSSAPTRL